MSTNHHGLTSDDIQPGPFSEHELREQWNAQADEYNQWDNLGLDEQLAWAQTRAIAADRAQGAPRDQPPSVAAADRPRYLRQTLDGWEAADHRDGPWRSFSAPQAVPPFPVVTALAVEAGSTPAADMATTDTSHPSLSPAAQAVLDGANSASSWGPDDCLNDAREIAAAALRAAVTATQAYGCDIGGAHWICEAEELLDIAAELDGHHG